jgi:hypothetical protein
MTSLIFLLLALAMQLAWLGHRTAGNIAFAVAAALSVAWLNHHITDPLKLAF